MEYWEGWMDWPLKEGWVCETCGKYAGLTWGLVNGRCRCDICHTEYMMRDGKKIVDIPISMLKPEYKDPARIGWERFKEPITDWNDDMWDEVIELAKEKLC